MDIRQTCNNIRSTFVRMINQQDIYQKTIAQVTFPNKINCDLPKMSIMQVNETCERITIMLLQTLGPQQLLHRLILTELTSQSFENPMYKLPIFRGFELLLFYTYQFKTRTDIARFLKLVYKMVCMLEGDTLEQKVLHYCLQHIFDDSCMSHDDVLQYLAHVTRQQQNIKLEFQMPEKFGSNIVCPKFLDEALIEMKLSNYRGRPFYYLRALLKENKAKTVRELLNMIDVDKSIVDQSMLKKEVVDGE